MFPSSFVPNPWSLAVQAQQGSDILDLTSSDPTKIFSPESVGPAFRMPNHFSSEAKGSLRLRSKLVDENRARGYLDPNRLFLTAGTSQAYSFLFKILGTERREILFPAPGYPLIENLAQAERLEANAYKIKPTFNGWSVDLSELKRKLNPSTAALILVQPNNPTGSVLSQNEWKEIVKLCEEHQIPLISDEVFLSYPVGEKPLQSLGEIETFLPRFVISGASKEWGYPQLKLSWLYAFSEIDFFTDFEERFLWLSDLFLSFSPSLEDFVLLPDFDGLERQKAILQRIQKNYAFLQEELRNHKRFKLMPISGGWSAVIQLLKDEEDILYTWLEKKDVLVQPGFLFDLPFSSFVVSLLGDSEVMKEAFKRISAAK